MTSDEEAEITDYYNNGVDRRGGKCSFSSTEDWHHDKFTQTKLLGPDYMSRAVSVCRDNFQPGITWGEPARLMADAMKRVRPMADAMKRGRPDAMKRGRPCLILVRRRQEPLDML